MQDNLKSRKQKVKQNEVKGVRVNDILGVEHLGSEKFANMEDEVNEEIDELKGPGRDT